MRKFIYLWLNGELQYRLRCRAVEEISTRLITQLKSFISIEFARKQRAINCFKLWKATKFRLILLYTSPVVVKSVSIHTPFEFILKRRVYRHFLTLHVIIRILSSQDFDNCLPYAQDLICFFIKTFIKLYSTMCLIMSIVFYISPMTSKNSVHLITLVLSNLKTICKC